MASKVTALKRAKLIRKLRRPLEQDLSLFIRQAWHIVEPNEPLIWNWHLDVICAYLEAYNERRIRNLIINVPFGSMKSLAVSVFFPAWAWTRIPARRFINPTNEIKLATRDSRRMKEVVLSDWYQQYWGDTVQLSVDQQEKAHFENTAKGFRQGIGITGSISGKRGTDLLIDDPIDTKKAFSDVEIAAVNDGYDQAVSSRLNNLARDGKLLIMQRVRTNDLTGHLLTKKELPWTQACIPMRYEGQPSYDPDKDLGTHIYHGRDIRDPRTERGELMFPERFPEEVVLSLEEDLGEYGTAGQLQQRPTPAGGGILKLHWWKVRTEQGLPYIKHMFASWDTAFSEKDLKTNAFSACTWWGIFYDEAATRDAMLMLGRWFSQAGYPELRAQALDLHRRLGEETTHLIEKKASGQSLIQDLRKHRGLRVIGYDPGPDGDKVARAYLASPTLKAGQVWVPEKKWATEVIDLVSEFPAGSPLSKDLTDTVTQAIQYLKRGWYLHHPDDDYDDTHDSMPPPDEDGGRGYATGVYG